MAKKPDAIAPVMMLAASAKIWPMTKIIPYPNNPRTHPADQITLLAKLMTLYGVDQPIVVDEEGFILKGHGRRMAAVEAGMKEFPVVQHKGLSEDDKKAIRLADNQVALLSGWDANLLRLELTELKKNNFDMPLLGFSGVALVSFLAAKSGMDPEAYPDVPQHAVTRPGDVWLMGKHRLLCGDSTKAADVERCLNGEEPNLMVTDQPYGVDYDPEWRKRVKRQDGSMAGAKAKGVVENDNRSDWREVWQLFPGNIVYVWHGALLSGSVQTSIEASGFQMRCQIIWNKQQFVVGRGDYHWKHEACFYGVRKGKTGDWTGDRKQSSVWDIDAPSGFRQIKEGPDAHTGIHSTQKPIECMRRPLLNNSRPGEYFYEPFSGSGTAIIAGEMETRYCLAIELLPAYVDVAVRRWETYAKLEATLEGDGRTFAEISKERTAKKKAPAKTAEARRKKSAAVKPRPSSDTRRGKRSAPPASPGL